MQTAPIGYAAKVAVMVEAAMVAGGFNVKTLSDATLIPRATLQRRLGGAPFTVEELASIAWVLGTQPSELVPPLAEVAA